MAARTKRNDPNRRVTLKDVALKAGTSANTVSLALRNSPLLAEETKKRIQKIAHEMKYVNNALAYSLRSGSSHTIAIVLGDISNPLFAIKIKELEGYFRERNYKTLILNTDEDPEKELSAAETVIGNHADGVVLCPCQKSREALELMQEYNLPFVLMGRAAKEDDAFDSVVWDDRKGGMLATQHLIKRGCKRILMLGASDYISSAIERERGYRDALAEADLTFDPTLVCRCAPFQADISLQLDRLRAEGITYDGLFCFSDLIAWEAARYHRANPLPLVGFDDIQAFYSVPFDMTSIGANVKEEVRTVAELLLGRIAAKEPRPAIHRVIDTFLVTR